jgi:PAS domain S-box-containing protein
MPDEFTSDPTGFDPELFFQLSHDLYCVAGFDGFFKKVNNAVIDTLGYTKEELFSRPINSFVYSDDQQLTEQTRENLRQSVPLRDFENRYVTKSGTVVWLCWNSVPVPESKLVFAVARNITHKKNQEADRNRLIDELYGVNAELKKLIYTVVHDLRSPVSSQVATYRLMDAKDNTAAEHQEYLDILRLSTDSLSVTLDNYMELLIQKNNFNAQLQEIHFQDALELVIKALHSLIRDAKATIITDFSAAEKICFNPTYLGSIFMNLITNSIKYARPDVAPVINITSHIVNQAVKLKFADNGSGFDVTKAGDRLFRFHERFHDHADSRGVGLYLVHTHLTNLGGSISVDSTPGQGTTFTLDFKN